MVDFGLSRGLKGCLIMDNRQIRFVAPGVAEVVPVSVGEPGRGQVLVRICVSSISSGTERANLVGNPNVGITGAGSVHFPRISGYSSAGVVERVGEGVTEFAPGDRVSLSWSTHTNYIVMDVRNVHHIGGLPFEAGALVHIATFPMAAVRKTRVEIGESMVVMGLGVLGLIAVRLSRLAGACPVIAVDPNAERREKALKFGADFALDPFAPDFAETVKKLTNGGARCAIEVTGNGKALDEVLDCMARFGRVALLGCTRESDFTIDYYRKVHGPGITLIGAHTLARPARDSSSGWWTEWDDEEAVIRLMRNGRMNLADMVERTEKVDDAPEVYARLANEKSFPITQFNWEKE